MGVIALVKKTLVKNDVSVCLRGVPEGGTKGTCPPHFFRWGGHNSKCPPHFFVPKIYDKHYVYHKGASSGTLIYEENIVACRCLILWYERPSTATLMLKNAMHSTRKRHGVW